jgi:hypothetical protein
MRLHYFLTHSPITMTYFWRTVFSEYKEILLVPSPNTHEIRICRNKVTLSTVPCEFKVTVYREKIDQAIIQWNCKINFFALLFGKYGEYAKLRKKY